MNGIVNRGRSLGAGRGYRPAPETSSEDTREFGGSTKNDDGGYTGFGSGNRGRRGGGGGLRGGSLRGGGFGGGQRDDNDGGNRGFGHSRKRYDDNGGNRGFGGGQKDDDGGGNRGFGGARRDDDGGGNRGFGGARRDNDGGGNRGFGHSRKRDDDDGGNRGFGGGRRDENGGGNRGFGHSRKRDDDDGGNRGFGGGRRDNDGGGNRGFDRSRKRDDDDGGNHGFGGGRRRDDEEGGGRGGGRGDGVERPPPYVPAEPSNDEDVLFHSSTSAGINFDRYDSIKIQVTGNRIPKPITSFAESGLRQLILENVEKSGYTKPTPVQKHALPIVMAGRDLMACAQTGSGKTAGFLLPIINSILARDDELVTDNEHTEPHAIIVSPTRELTQQIYDEARKYAFGSTCKINIAYGGTSTMYQARKVLSGSHILVATPGRLMDFVQRGKVTFSSVKFVVLDEGDRMLDMGFLPDMEKMLNHPTMTPLGERQTLLFSATFPEEIQQLARKFMDDYVFLAVGIVGGACSDVTQTVHEVGKFEKREKVESVLREDDTSKVLVFVETKRSADFVAAFLSGRGFSSTSIHGDREQPQREEALRDFKTGKRRVLVATAVASRGLDIKDVGHVINFDMPKTIDEYVHRIGRTGRVGNKGKATSFFDPDADENIREGLVKILSQSQQHVPEFLLTSSVSAGGDGFSQDTFGGRDIRRTKQSSGNWGGAGDHAAEVEDGW